MTTASGRAAVGETTRWRPVVVAALAGVVVTGGSLSALAAGGWIRPTVPILGSVVGQLVLYTAIVATAVTTATRAAGPQRLTVATWLTLARGWLLAVFVGVVVGSNEFAVSWLLAGLFVGSAVGDMADGWVARRTDTVSELGATLDTETDALLVLVGAVTVVWIGSAPAVFLAIGLARYAFVGGLVVRQIRGRPVFDLEPSRFRKFTGAAIVATITVALAPVVDPAVSRAISWVVTVPILAHFLWDWLAASGRLD